MNGQLSWRAVTATLEWIDEIRTRPPTVEPDPEPIRPRISLGPYIRSVYEGWEPDPTPEVGHRHLHVEADSMGLAVREGLARAREFWPWLQVQSVAGIAPAGTGWRVTVNVTDDCDPRRRRRWRIADMGLRDYA